VDRNITTRGIHGRNRKTITSKGGEWRHAAGFEKKFNMGGECRKSHPMEDQERRRRSRGLFHRKRRQKVLKKGTCTVAVSPERIWGGNWARVVISGARSGKTAA